MTKQKLIDAEIYVVAFEGRLSWTNNVTEKTSINTWFIDYEPKQVIDIYNPLFENFLTTDVFGVTNLKFATNFITKDYAEKLIEFLKANPQIMKDNQYLMVDENMNLRCHKVKLTIIE